ncbi:MAG TPA: hypothetical protein VGF00_17755, partial [Acidimicrobiia bacterium]
QDGLLSRKADTTVVGAMVGTAPVEITPGGIAVAGTAGPAPDTSAVNTALQGAGITVEILPKGETASGVTAPALRITSQDKSGSAVTYVLGRASASVEGTAAPTGQVEQTGGGPAPTAGSTDAPADAAPPSDAQSPVPEVASSNSETPGVEAPTSPDLLAAPEAAGFASSPSPPVDNPAPANTEGALPPGGGHRRARAGTAQGADSRVAIIATRALLNGGDTRSLYAACLAGIGLCLALAVGLNLLTRRVRSGER